MIVDSLEQSGRYFSLNPCFSLAFSALRTSSPHTSGRIELDGDNAFILFSQSQGKKRHETMLEAHRRYIDIHYCFDGVEEIGWRPTQACQHIKTPYDEQNDFTTFVDPAECWVVLTPGLLAIFFPEDAHAPMVSDGLVTKSVVKVKVV